MQDLRINVCAGGTVAVYVYATTPPLTVLGTGTVVNPGTGKSATVAISLDTTTYVAGPLTLGAAYSGEHTPPPLLL